MKYNKSAFFHLPNVSSPFIHDFTNYFKENNVHFSECTLHSFADKELYCTWNNGSNFQIILPLFSCSKEQSINDQLLALLLELQTLKNKNSILVLPYFPYARHDSNKHNFFFSLLSLFKQVGVRACITCDIHNEELCEFSPMPLYSISMTPFWNSLLTKVIMDQSWMVVAPDKGSIPRAQALAQDLGLSFSSISKERYAPNKTRIVSFGGDVKDKTIILIDDIIDTASTAINALELLLEHDARAVVGCFTHAVLSDNAYHNISYSRFHHVYLTDSLDVERVKNNNKITCIPLGKFIAQNVEKIIERENL